ncbi:hypothetical protein DC498_16820 [Terrimonas sp.]|uniref:hypothetical protein n=1 Tax=Terrimonas sp. TaxID=1914338 RepID=UPI000D517EA8|nr:hypothetical protein [Terrimonas sp.]PVD51077.1 hypothetical protein DC498_16820 [Terrimonas sp.]
MFWGSHYINRNEIFIYIEKFNKLGNYVLADFVDSNEFGFFNQVTNMNYDYENNPSMLEILNYSQKQVREGTVYRVSFETITTLIPQIQIVEDSLIIGFRIDLLPNGPELFGKPKSFSAEERFWLNMDDTQRDYLPNIDKVIVRNIGQGNWNELASDKKFVLIYDSGTIYSTKADIVKTIAGSRNIEYQKDKPVLILSHWDVDHYHFLTAFDDETIKSFCTFIYRASIPNLTARKVLGRFRKLNKDALCPLACIDPSPKKSSSKLIGINLTINKNIILYNASKNPSRNKSGIGLCIRKKNYCVILPGDFDYSQISDFILPDLAYACNHYLIVPHHGGKAGKFEYKTYSNNILKEAVISVGKNPYNPPHPHANNVINLKAKGFSVIRTDIIDRDYIIKF